MYRMTCEGERGRIELALDILEYAATRLDSRSYVPMSVLTDVVTFIDASEEAAFEALLTGDASASCCCANQYGLAHVALGGMRQALRALDEGEAAGAIRFVRFARDYIRLRREHMRLDPNLFERAPIRRCEPDGVVDLPADVSAMGAYKRLVAAVAALDILTAPLQIDRPRRAPRIG
jgi:hypothetical protein